MKEILLTKHKLTYVDDEAYETLSYYPWNTFRYNSGKKYRDGTEAQAIAARRVYSNGRHYIVYLHRILAGVPQCFRVGWYNGNRLDNQHENLRIYDKKGNNYSFRQFTGKSNFKGVRWNAYYGLWEALCYKMSIGLYANEVDAARAFNVKIREIFPKPGRDRLNSIPVMNRYLRNNDEEDERFTA